MDKTKSKLATLLGMLKKRQVGTTTLMQTGTNNYDREFILVTNTRVHAEMVIEKADANLVKMATLENMHTFSHLNLPVAVDHHALVLLLNDVTDEIEKNEKQIGALVQTVNKMISIVEVYQDRSHALETAAIDIAFTPWWKFKKLSKLKTDLFNAVNKNVDETSVKVEQDFTEVKNLINLYAASNKTK